MFSREVRTQIVIEMIASVILLGLLQPIARVLWPPTIRIASRVIGTAVDWYYRSAALAQRDWVVVYVFMIVILAMVSHVMTRPVVSLLRPAIRKLQPLSPTQGRLVDLAARTLWMLFAFFLLAVVFVDLQVNTSFQQRLAVLAPHISEQQNLELKAQWAMMDSRGDYESIVALIETLAEQHNITLPPLLELAQ